MSMLTTLKKEGILSVVNEGCVRRPQVLALGDLLNLCEGKQIVQQRLPL